MKNKKSLLLVIPAMAIISLTGCGNNSNSEPLSLFSNKTRFIGTIKSDPETPTVLPPETFANMRIAPLATYHLSNKGDVPYEGTIEILLPNKKDGFIKCIDGNSYYFKGNSVNYKGYGCNQKVVFYLKDGFDKKKQRPTKQAYDIILKK